MRRHRVKETHTQRGEGSERQTNTQKARHKSSDGSKKSRLLRQWLYAKIYVKNICITHTRPSFLSSLVLIKKKCISIYKFKKSMFIITVLQMYFFTIWVKRFSYFGRQLILVLLYEIYIYIQYTYIDKDFLDKKYWMQFNYHRLDIGSIQIWTSNLLSLCKSLINMLMHLVVFVNSYCVWKY